MNTPAGETVILIGWVRYLVDQVRKTFPAMDLVVIEDPQVIIRPAIVKAIATTGVTGVPWGYSDDYAADLFYREHRDLNVRAVIPAVEYCVAFAARLAERFGVPGATLGAARLLRDKASLRQVTAGAGVSNPQCEHVESLEQVYDFMDRHPGSVVVKPSNRQGSVGTRIIHAREATADAWYSALVQEEVGYVPYQSLPISMLVEEFIAGTEFSVEMLFDAGVSRFANVTGKLLYDGDRPVELGHVVPADISRELSESLIRATTDVIDIVGFATGVVHCEWIVKEDELYLVECAGRMPGDGIVDLIERAWPIDLVARYVAMMGGVAVPDGPDRAQGAAAVLYPPVAPGLVVSVDGLDEASAVEGIYQSGSMVQPGDHVNELRSSWDRVLGAAATGSTPAEALRRVTLAADKFVVKTVPE
jgi:phosphoribosylamine-glycine ligase